jgi:hypothetical protein
VPNLTIKQAFYILLIIFGALITHHAYFPGIVVNDSSTQFHQAQTFQFDDWHPPIMAFIWSLTNRVVPGPEGFFLLQIVLYWSGFLLIGLYIINELDTRQTSYVRYVGLCLLPFSPFLLNICGTIWKDVLVFGCFALALGLILSRPKRSSIWTWRSAIIWGLVLIGSLARHNSVIAAVPLLVLHFWPDAPDRKQLLAVVGRGLIAAVLTVTVVLGVGKVLDTFVLHSTKEYMENEILLFDLMGISHRANQNLLPGNWSDDEQHQIVASCYSPLAWSPASPWGRCHFIFDRLWQTGAWQQGLLPLWMRAVANHRRNTSLIALIICIRCFGRRPPLRSNPIGNLLNSASLTITRSSSSGLL